MKSISILLSVFWMIFNAGCNKKMVPVTSSIADTTAVYHWAKFNMGADLSYVLQMKSKEVIYKDSGKAIEAFDLFKNNGCNTVRLKLWHSPKAYSSKWGNDQDYNSLEQVASLIQMAKSAGMAVNLNLHYSDTWADPQKQIIPAAWAGLDLTTMKDSVYRYTLYVLNYLNSKDLVPEMIQVGNETNTGMLWPVGKVDNNDFNAFAQLLNSGIKAVRDFSASSVIKPKIILHEAQLQTASWWIAGIVNAGVTDFDIIGLSHYADWSTINNMTDITALIKKLKATYNKEVMIVEVAYWWNTKDAAGNNIKQTPVAGYPFSNDGQYRYLKDLTQAIIDGGGTGIQYWAPDYMNSRGGEMTARSLVDFSGNALPGIWFMKYAYHFFKK